MLGEPLHDVGHLRLERPRDGEVEHPGSSVAAVLEIVGDAAGHEHERAPGRRPRLVAAGVLDVQLTPSAAGDRRPPRKPGSRFSNLLTEEQTWFGPVKLVFSHERLTASKKVWFAPRMFVSTFSSLTQAEQV